MKINKKKRITFILVIEGLLFMYGYWFGSRGLMVLHTQHRRNDELTAQLARGLHENARLEQELIAWQSNPLCKERYARETLQMARADEVVYFIES